MKIILLAVFLFSAFQAISQKQEMINSPCDTAWTQKDLNECAYQEYLILNAVINKKYNCIKSYFDQKYLEHLNDTNSLTQHYISLKQAIIISQENWEVARDANMNFYSKLHEGTLGMQMQVNLSSITDARNRIIKLNEMIQTLFQEEETFICE